MKNIISSLALLLLSLMARAGSTVTLRGKIIHPIADTISVKFNTGKVVYDQQIYTTRLQPDGTFQLSFPLSAPFAKVYIVHGAETSAIYAAPGYNLYMSLDALHFDSTLHFSGTGSAEANFCAKHVLLYNYTNIIESYAQNASKTDIPGFTKSLDSLRQIELNFLGENQQGLSNAFIRHWLAVCKYAGYCSALYYPIYHQITIQHNLTLTNIPLSDYLAVANVPADFNNDLLYLTEYRTYLDRLYSQRLSAADITNRRDSAGMHYVQDDSVLSLAYAAMPTASAEVFVAAQLYRHARQYPADLFNSRLQQFRVTFPKSEYLPVLQQASEQIVGSPQGRPAPNFTLRTINGKTVRLSDFRGKVVLLDFWASWCMPCLAEMPHARNIEEYYNDKDVVFLFISIDDDEPNWKKAVGRQQTGGIQMRDAGRYGSTTARLYHVESVPAYFLIDRHGNFAPNPAPRPSDHNRLKSAIDGLLK